LDNVRVNSIAFDPRGPETMFVATDLGGVLRSDDTGASWHPVNEGLPAATIDAFAGDPSNADVVYAANAGGGIYRTDDRGRHGAGPYGNGPVKAMAVNPGDPNEVFAIGQPSLWRSRDRGVTWDVVHNFNVFSSNAFSALIIDPKPPYPIYV